jgi:hypothetical protein
VPVANPEGVAPLLALAIAAGEPDDPPPRVLALVRPPAGKRPEAKEPAPSTPALLAAVEYARAHSAAITTQSVWSDNPAIDIIAAAQAAEVAWVLLGYHRAASGSDTLGGVVRGVFERARALPINIGAFIQGTDRPFERIFAAVDTGTDGRAALALAARIARRNKSRLRALLVENSVSQLAADLPEDGLVDMIRQCRDRIGPRFHSDVLTKRSLHQLFRQTPGRLLIVGKRFADEVGLPIDEVPGGDRCVIVVDGAEPAAAVGAHSRRA